MNIPRILTEEDVLAQKGKAAAAGSPAPAPPAPAPAPAPSAPPSAPSIDEAVEKLVAENSKSQLEDLASGLGLDTSGNKPDIARRIAESQVG